MMNNPHNSEQKILEFNLEENGLVWPVFFLYPQYGQTDFVQKFDESSTYLNLKKQNLKLKLTFI